MTRTDANKQIVAEFITALFTNGDLTAVDRYLDAGFVNHDPPFPGAPDGPEGMRKAAEIFRRAFPDWRSGVQQLIATATRRRDGPLTPGRPGGHAAHDRCAARLPGIATQKLQLAGTPLKRSFGHRAGDRIICSLAVYPAG
jgi:SnoaL-like polyketide cyclase